MLREEEFESTSSLLPSYRVPLHKLEKELVDLQHTYCMTYSWCDQVCSGSGFWVVNSLLLKWAGYQKKKSDVLLGKLGKAGCSVHLAPQCDRPVGCIQYHQTLCVALHGWEQSGRPVSRCMRAELSCVSAVKRLSRFMPGKPDSCSPAQQ